MNESIFSRDFPNKPKNRFEFSFHNQKIIFEIDQLASKSDKSIICRYGNTTVLTVLTIKQLTKNVNSFFPLSISFEEKFYAIGKIPNIFSKREGKPSYDAITAARLIDRSLRSFFPLESNQQVHINSSVLSMDQECDPRIVSIWNSFLVCYLSPNLPYFQTPLAAVIIGQSAGKFLVNPSNEKLNVSSLELIVSATEEKITMLEASAQEISEGELEKAIEFAQKEIQLLTGFFQHIFNSLEVKQRRLEIEWKGGKKSMDDWNWCGEGTESASEKLEKKTDFHLGQILLTKNISWIEKEKKMKEVRQELTKEYYQENPHLAEEYVKGFVEQVWDNCLRNRMRKLWKEEQVRLDGRKAHQIRPLQIQIDYLPNVHGSAVFARGETKVLSVITIGKISEKQLIDNIFAHSHKYFIHHYNFPPFAVNEITSYRSVSRREIGHGELVERTFDYLIPASSTFPYTTRAVSEVLSSDGSSSQASICATSLALMTAGIPLLRPAAGIALGLFEGQIYSDINGLEDKLGEMDFKIAGTEKGVCSIQLDVKNKGISQEIIKESFEKARQARLYLLEEMKKYIFCPRPTLPTQVIKCRRFYIEKEKIGLVIGLRGKTINQITEETGSTIEIQTDGYILIYHQEEEKLEKTYQIIKNIIKGSLY